MPSVSVQPDLAPSFSYWDLFPLPKVVGDGVQGLDLCEVESVKAEPSPWTEGQLRPREGGARSRKR